MINIPHIDRVIWNAEYKTIEIISELQRTKRAEISVDGEGSDLTELGLYRLLDSICEQFKFAKSAITIHTHNQLETHSEYKIVRKPPLYIVDGQNFAKSTVLPNKTIKKHFGIFINRSSWQRLLLASYLYKNYSDKLCLTYRYNSASDYHKHHLSFDQLSHQLGLSNALELTSDLLKKMPIEHDQLDVVPIPVPTTFGLTSVYKDFFAEIVCETFCYGQSFYPTEKTWRPLVCKTPFMVQGPCNFLKNLRSLGFKTFGQWWDESYDEDGGTVAIATIQRNIDMLAKLTPAQLQDLYTEMQPTLEHNYNVFMSLSDKEFTQWK